ncbi:MAG: hypothetical protein K2Y22_06355 [Candidatus Obscuribacterales bacterium]|nr:hypothetical protein [Candidatus Obscuribacterales bacterium]
MENNVSDIVLFELTAEEKSALKQAFETVVAEAAAAQQEYDHAAAPIESEAEEKRQKLWAEFRAAKQVLDEVQTPLERHHQAVKPLEDKIHSVTKSLSAQIQELMQSIENRLPAPLFDGLNGEAVRYDEAKEQDLGAMVGPVEIAEYNIEKRLVPSMSDADWETQKALYKPERDLSDKRQKAAYAIDSQLGAALRPHREKLNARLKAAKSVYDKTVQDLVEVVMLRAGLDVTDIQLDRAIGADDDDE